MTSLTRILAATDLSAHARHATERAALVSKDTAALLDLLHVANLAPLERLRQLMDTSPEEMERRVLDAARQRLHDLAASLQQRYGVVAGTHAVVGPVLAELARQKPADSVCPVLMPSTLSSRRNKALRLYCRMPLKVYSGVEYQA